MPSYSPELIHSMRVVLNEVMTKIPVDQATPAVKAYMAEIILKAAARGQTNYEVLLAVASEQKAPTSVTPTSGRGMLDGPYGKRRECDLPFCWSLCRTSTVVTRAADGA